MAAGFAFWPSSTRSRGNGLGLLADQSLTGEKVAQALEPVVAQRGAPRAITVDNGSEFAGRVMDAWAYRHGIQLDFIRPGEPVENSFIESFNGRLWDECLNVEVFFTLEDVRQKLSCWQENYNRLRPHSSLQDQAPATFVADWLATVQTAHACPELVETLTGAMVFTSPHRRLKPIMHRPNPQVSSGLDSRGGWYRAQQSIQVAWFQGSTTWCR
jgi:Integrase core domain